MFVFPGSTAVRSPAADGRGAQWALTTHSTYQRANHRGFLPDPGKADTKGLRKDNSKPCSCDSNETPRLAEPPPPAVEVAGKDFRPEEEHAAPCVISST